MTDETTAHKPKLDGSINIPTLLALVGLLVGQGFLPGGSGETEAAMDKALETHASLPHAGSVPLATYQLERSHDREWMDRIEKKLDQMGDREK